MTFKRLILAILLLSPSFVPAVENFAEEPLDYSTVTLAMADRQVSDRSSRSDVAVRAAAAAPTTTSSTIATTTTTSSVSPSTSTNESEPTTTTALTPSTTVAAKSTSAKANVTRRTQRTEQATNATVPAPATEQVSETSSEPAGEGNSDVVAVALKQVGKSYVYGATGPNSFDCSGLVFYVFNQAGINVPRLTSDTYYSKYPKVSRSELQPGDLIVGRGHIGIYTGNGRMVHASTPRGGVKHSAIDSPGRPFGFVRIPTK